MVINILFGLILIAIGVAIGYYLFNKPVIDCNEELNSARSEYYLYKQAMEKRICEYIDEINELQI